MKDVVHDQSSSTPASQGESGGNAHGLEVSGSGLFDSAATSDSEDSNGNMTFCKSSLEEMLTYRIVNLLPAEKLSGVVTILDPDGTKFQIGEEFIIDLSTLSRSKLVELDEYVEDCLRTPKKSQSTSLSSRRASSLKRSSPSGVATQRKQRRSAAGISESRSNCHSGPAQAGSFEASDQGSEEEIDVVGL